MDPMGELAIQVSLVGHQTKWSGREHLPIQHISETGVPALTLGTDVLGHMLDDHRVSHTDTTMCGSLNF
jgi:hypothetical protein